MISTFTALIDANVFYGARLRSLVLFVAQSGTFRARWTEQIHTEWMTKLLEKRPDLSMPQLQKTRESMDRSVPDCIVVGYESLIENLKLPDPDDRHVLAAAIRAGADVIVTFNLGDFPDEILAPYGIHTKTPDDFFLDLESLHPAVLLDAAAKDKAHYKNPKLSVDEYISSLRTARIPGVAEYIEKVRIAIDGNS